MPLITYDYNGNIKSLDRYTEDGMDYLDMLSYSYINEGNRLESVVDNGDIENGFIDVGTEEIDYSYDGNGNMQTDQNKGINSSIRYNYLNLPEEVDRNESTTSYVYDAMGRKLEHTVFNGTTTKTTKYSGSFVYEDGSLAYIIGSEGRILPESDGTYKYEYHLKDHLGNTRVTYLEDREVVQTASYYPFGMQHTSINNLGTTNNYLYNGKELQEDLDWYDYGSRMYDAATGRWMCLDPQANKYYSISPYAYVANNPIKYIDPNGEEIIIYSMSGEHTYTPGQAYTGKDAYISSTVKALNYLHSGSETAQKMINNVSGKEEVISIMQTDESEIPTSAEVNTGWINFDEESGLITTDFESQSPAIGLAHELAHQENILEEGEDAVVERALQDDPDYDNKEEKKVIEEVEKPIVNELNENGANEGTREGHSGTLFRAKCSTCNNDQ